MTTRRSDLVAMGMLGAAATAVACVVALVLSVLAAVPYTLALSLVAVASLGAFIVPIAVKVGSLARRVEQLERRAP